MQKIFSRMLTTEFKNDFLAKNIKKSISRENAEIDELKAYVLSDEYITDINRLIKGDYFLDLPDKYLIRKVKSGKYRTVYAFHGKTKMLLKAMNHALSIYDYLFSDSLYSYRSGKGHSLFFKNLQNLDTNNKFYIVKTDISSYADNIDQDILLKLMKRIFSEDPEFYNFLYWLLKRNQYIRNGTVISERFNLICGNPLGSFFFNSFLMNVDKIFEKYPLYMRFSDDIAIFCKTEKEIDEAKNILFTELKKLNLKLNPDKTKLYYPGEAFSVLGLKYYNNKIDISDYGLQKILKRIEREELRILRLKRSKKLSDLQAYNEAFSFYKKLFCGKSKRVNNRSWCIWHLSTITTDETLKIIDKRIQRMFRVVMSGKRSDACYRIKYKQICRNNYYTLVHLYHHREDLSRIFKLYKQEF